MRCACVTLPARNRTTPQYFTCFGRLHVKEALLMIIVGTFAWDILRWTNFFLQRHITGDWLEILTEICDALFGVLLLVAYITESAPYLLPYLFMQLFTLVVSSILYFICAATIAWVNNPWAIHFHGETPTPTDTRLRALLYSLFPLTFSLILIWVIKVLLASYRYFEDKKLRRVQDRVHPIVYDNRTNGPSADPTEPSVNQISTAVTNQTSTEVTNHISTAIPSEDNLSQQRFTAPNGFANENFTLSDEDDEHDDQLWPQKLDGNARPI